MRFCRDLERPGIKTHAVVAWRGGQGQVGLEFHHTDTAEQTLLREICADFLMKPLVRLSEKHG